MEGRSRKIKRINIRISKEELELIEKKASAYPSLTSLIIDAVKNYDNRLGSKKLDALNEWAIEFKAFQTELNRIGNNINQLAHYVNSLSSAGIKSVEIVEVVNKTIEEYNTMFKNMVELQKSFVKRVTKI